MDKEIGNILISVKVNRETQDVYVSIFTVASPETYGDIEYMKDFANVFQDFFNISRSLEAWRRLANYLSKIAADNNWLDTVFQQAKSENIFSKN